MNDVFVIMSLEMFPLCYLLQNNQQYTYKQCSLRKKKHFAKNQSKTILSNQLKNIS